MLSVLYTGLALLHRYCPLCKNDESEVVKAGEKLKASKKKAKMASATTTSNRDWGKVKEQCVCYSHGIFSIDCTRTTCIN